MAVWDKKVRKLNGPWETYNGSEFPSRLPFFFRGDGGEPVAFEQTIGCLSHAPS